MRHAIRPYLGAALLALTWPGHAAIEVSFIEDAPRDRFVIANTSACTLEGLRVTLDLAPSAGGLYFDTTGEGAGVQVFQPFEAASGNVQLLRKDGDLNEVADGQDALDVRVTRLAAGERAEFTIDVDDRVIGGLLGQSRVASSEIAGARIHVTAGAHPAVEGIFDTTGRAVTPDWDCGA